MTDEALVDERLEGIDVGVGDFLGRLQRAPPAKTANLANSSSLGVAQQVVAPLDRSAERLLAWVGVAATLQQVESPRQALQDLRRRQDPRPGSGQLDGEGQVVEAAAQLSMVSSPAVRTVPQKSSTASGSASGGTGYSTSPATRSSSRLVVIKRRLGHDSSRDGQLRRGFDDLLEVVDEEQHLALADVLGETILGTDRLADGRVTSAGSRSARAAPRRRRP